MERNQGLQPRPSRRSGTREAAAMMESRSRGPETRERRVECRTRGFPYACAYGLCYTVQGLHLQYDMGTIQEERLRRGPPHFMGAAG